MPSEHAGFAVRRAREESGLTAAAVARRAAMSASYLSQIETNQRPLTPSVHRRLAEAMGVPVQELSGDGSASLAAELQDAFLVQPDLGEPSSAELHRLSEQSPRLAQALLTLATQRVRDQDRIAALEARLGDDRGEPHGPPMPYETVRDFFARNRNYFHSLDVAAEELAAQLRLQPAERLPRLIDHLASLGIRVEQAPRSSVGADRRYDAGAHVIRLAQELAPSRQAFQLASQLALLTVSDLIDAEVAGSEVSDDVTARLTRIGLANYFAGALTLPYQQFLSRARAVRYDIEALGEHFDVSFETVCHRLNALQRPEDPGIPFALIRVDRAGNISKRQSATPFHFSRSGGTCPLWIVYDAFSRPADTLRQITEMPDGRRYLWVARAVTTALPGFRSPRKTFAVGLGCDLAYADQLVYSQGLDLSDPRARTPIGPGCKVCDRPACPQRAFPFTGRTLQVDENSGQFFPYLHQRPANTQ